MSPRPKRKRIIKTPPAATGFVPESGDFNPDEKIILGFEEYEAFKLVDYDRLTHLEASRELGVSRPTFTRIYDSARKKIAAAFVENKALAIEGGDVHFEEKWMRCMQCGTVYKLLPEHDNVQKGCPVCGSENISPLQQAENVTGRGWGFGRGRGGHRGGRGSEGNCICPKCGYTTPHTPGTPCNAVLCPHCNIRMIREGSEHHRFILRMRKKND